MKKNKILIKPGILSYNYFIIYVKIPKDISFESCLSILEKEEIFSIGEVNLDIIKKCFENLRDEKSYKMSFHIKDSPRKIFDDQPLNDINWNNYITLLDILKANHIKTERLYSCSYNPTIQNYLDTFKKGKD